MKHTLTVSLFVLGSLASACGGSEAATSSSARSIVAGPETYAECANRLKQDALAGTISIDEYKDGLLAQCPAAPVEEPGPGTAEPGPSIIDPTSECLSTVKQEVLDGTLAIEDYDGQVAARCPGAPVPEQPGEPAPGDTAPQVDNTCAGEVKAEVLAGTLPIEDYESAVAARCP